MPPTRRFAAPMILLLVFAVSRLLFQPVSLGVSTFSLRGNVAARAIGAVEGRNFDAATLGNGMPILDRELLLHDLWRSLWYLHSQPPLFNLFVAGVLRLPGDFARNYQWINWAMAVALYLGTYALMRRMNIGRAFAAGCVTLFMLNPNAMWMESAVYYGLPLALMLLVAALAWERALRMRSASWLAIAAIFVVLLPLTRAFFTAMWCLLVLGYFAFVFVRRHGRMPQVLAAILLPLSLLAAFQIKQFIVFGQVLGSSWFGCNLATMTASMSNDKVRDLAAGKISPLVKVYRNAPPEEFLPYFKVRPTGIPVLDNLKKSTGQPNFNHFIYIPVGKIFLRDTLYLIAHHPHKYLLNVLNSVYLFCGYQIGVYFDYPKKFFARWSWAEIAAPFLGFPLLVLALWTGWRRLHRGDPDERPLVAFLLFNIVYVMAVSCLFEKSESAVYRYQIDAFLWLFLAIAAEFWLPQLVRQKVRLPVPTVSDVRN